MKRAQIIRDLINKTGMNVKAFAREIGLPYSTLRSILERGIGNASVDNVIKICKGLNITIEELENMALDKSASKDNTIEFQPKEGNDVFTRAAHKIGHDGPLTDEEKEKIALAIRVALARHNK